MNIRDKFVKAIRSEQRTFKHDRSKSLGASETFACLRKGYYTKRHPELANPGSADNMNWGILERGNVIENAFAVPKLKLIFGEANCEYMGIDQDTFVVGQSSATPDGLIKTDDRGILAEEGVPDIESDCFMTEIKSFDSRMNLREEKFIHKGQTIMQLGHIRHLTEFKPMYSLLLYINANDYTDIRPFVIKFDEAAYTLGKKRSDIVFSATDVNKVPPEGRYTDQCRYCNFTQACKGAELRVFPTAVSNYNSNEVALMRSLAADYDQARADVKDAEKRKGQVEETIRTTLAEMKTRGIEADDFKVTYSKIDGKESIDKDAIKAFLKEHGANYDDFTKKGQDFTKLTVTIR